MKIQILTGPHGELLGVQLGPVLSRRTHNQAAGLIVPENHRLREVEVEDDLVDCNAAELHKRISEHFLRRDGGLGGAPPQAGST